MWTLLFVIYLTYDPSKVPRKWRTLNGIRMQTGFKPQCLHCAIAPVFPHFLSDNHSHTLTCPPSHTFRVVPTPLSDFFFTFVNMERSAINAACVCKVGLTPQPYFLSVWKLLSASVATLCYALLHVTLCFQCCALVSVYAKLTFPRSLSL